MARGMRPEFCVNFRVLILFESQRRKLSEDGLDIGLNCESHHLPGAAQMPVPADRCDCPLDLTDAAVRSAHCIMPLNLRPILASASGV